MMSNVLMLSKMLIGCIDLKVVESETSASACPVPILTINKNKIVGPNTLSLSSPNV